MSSQKVHSIVDGIEDVDGLVENIHDLHRKLKNRREAIRMIQDIVRHRHLLLKYENEYIVENKDRLNPLITASTDE